MVRHQFRPWSLALLLIVVACAFSCKNDKENNPTSPTTTSDTNTGTQTNTTAQPAPTQTNLPDMYTQFRDFRTGNIKVLGVTFTETFAITVHQLTFEDATKLAQSYGMKLVFIHAQEENDFLAATYGNSYGSPWIGLSQISPGVWQWSDGNPLGFANWAPGEPSSGNENCVMTNWMSPGKWNNGTCPDLRYAIVRVN